MMRRGFRILLAAVVLIAAVPAGKAGAHAKLVRADPAPDSTVAVAPKVVKVWFSEELRPKGSTLEVVDSRGVRVDDRKGRVDLDDLDRMTLIGGLKAMGRGKYTVRWTAVSADDRDMAKGTFSFTVR
jgi:methionine-rich copper-binding protein CopC